MNSILNQSNRYQINFDRMSKILKDIAHEKNITQAELALGVTTRDHLNKILNGKRQPSLELLYLLCNKLEIDIKTLLLKCHFTNYEASDLLIQKMTKYLSTFKMDKYELLFQELEDNSDFQYGFGKQFLLKTKGIILLKNYQNYEDAIYYLNLALDLIPNSSLKEQTGLTFLYTGEELEIYTFKAECLFRLGHHDEAIQLLTTLLTTRIKSYESTNIRIILYAIYSLAKFLLHCERYEDAITCASAGIKNAKAKFTYIYYPDFHMILGKSYFELNNLQDAQTHLQQAYEMYRLFEYNNFRAMIINYCKDNEIPLKT